MALVWQRNLHQNMPEFIESSFWLVIKFLQRMNLMVGPSLKPLTGMVFPIVSFEVLGKFTKGKIENSLTNLGLLPRLSIDFPVDFSGLNAKSHEFQAEHLAQRLQRGSQVRQREIKKGESGKVDV